MQQDPGFKSAESENLWFYDQKYFRNHFLLA